MLGVFLAVLVYKMNISENEAVDLWVGILSGRDYCAMWVAFWSNNFINIWFSSVLF